MARIILPLPAFTEVKVSTIRPGDWISDDGLRWHLVREVHVASVVVGETPDHAVEVAADPSGIILRLDPADAPRYPITGTTPDEVAIIPPDPGVAVFRLDDPPQPRS